MIFFTSKFLWTCGWRDASVIDRRCVPAKQIIAQLIVGPAMVIRHGLNVRTQSTSQIGRQCEASSFISISWWSYWLPSRNEYIYAFSHLVITCNKFSDSLSIKERCAALSLAVSIFYTALCNQLLRSTLRLIYINKGTSAVGLYNLLCWIIKKSGILTSCVESRSSSSGEIFTLRKGKKNTQVEKFLRREPTSQCQHERVLKVCLFNLLVTSSMIPFCFYLRSNLKEKSQMLHNFEFVNDHENNYVIFAHEIRTEDIPSAFLTLHWSIKFAVINLQ